MCAKILYTDLFEYPTDVEAQQNWVTDAAGLELDYFEYATDPIAQATYVTSGSKELPSGDLVDETCTNLDDWTDISLRSGSVIVNPAGQYKFDSGDTSAANNDYAAVMQDFGSLPNTFTFEIKIKHDALGARGDSDHFEIRLRQADEQFRVYLATDGIFIQDTDDGVQEVGTNLVKFNGSAEFQIWRFLVTFGAVGDGTCDVYLKDSTHDWTKEGTGVTCSAEGSYTDGEFYLYQLGYANNNRISHIDYIKIDSGLTVPSFSLQCYSEDTIIQQGTYSLKVVALQTASLNDTLTKSGLSLDLTDISELKIDFRASRTGTNLQVQLAYPSGYGSDITAGQSYDCIPVQAPGWDADKAFDDDEASFWQATAVTTGWVGVDFTTTRKITKVRIKPFLRRLQNFKIHGSNTSYIAARVELYSGVHGDNADWEDFVLTTTGDYRYYILECIDTYAGLYLSIYEIEMMEVGEATHTKDIVISSANTWETTTWDISGIANANKDNIDQIIFKILNADFATTFYVDNFRSEEALQCYSEDTIKVQGDYSLKVLATQTDSLNKTLTKTLTDYLDYSIQDVIKFDVRASRTGTNLQLQIHDVGGVTSTHNINIVVANTWQTETWDISGIAVASRDTIDKIIVKVPNADASNTAYLDNLYSQVIVESAHVFIGG